MNKASLRLKYLDIRNSLTAAIRKKKSEAIANHILNHAAIKRAKVIFTYLPFHSEVDLNALIKTFLNYKVIVVPKIIDKKEMIAVVINNLEEDIKFGYQGIKEPLSNRPYKNNIHTALVPGICFNQKKFRIGYGKGYYDIFFQNYKRVVPTPLYKIGCYFSEQFSQEFIAEDHDVSMDIIITEDG